MQPLYIKAMYVKHTVFSNTNISKKSGIILHLYMARFKMTELPNRFHFNLLPYYKLCRASRKPYIFLLRQ